MKKFLIILFFVIICAVGGSWWLWGVNFQTSNTLSLSETKKTVINGAHVSLAMSDMLIFETPNKEVGVIQFTSMTPDSGANYSAWFFPSPTGPISLKEAQPQNGHVFEKYWRTRIGLKDYHVMNIGGKYTIDCGSIKLNWSASTWIYFPPEYKFAIISGNNVDSVDIKGAELKWYKT